MSYCCGLHVIWHDGKLLMFTPVSQAAAQSCKPPQPAHTPSYNSSLAAVVFEAVVKLDTLWVFYMVCHACS